MNLLEALNSLANNKRFHIPLKGQDYDNTIQEVGSGMEAFFKLLFVEKNTSEELNKVFCFQGSANHPPDLITASPQIAFEIKKKNTLKGTVQLNSSYPAQNLSNENKRLTQECKKVLRKKKSIPLIYTLGTVVNGAIEKLWLIDGALYAANQKIYLDVSHTLKEAIQDSDICNMQDTKELAHIKEIDPLKITLLRVRGMWIIKEPSVVFKYLGDFNSKVTAILSQKTYNIFSQASQKLVKNNKNISVRRTKCKNPDNPSASKRVILLEL